MVKVGCIICRGIPKRMKHCTHCGGTGVVELKNKYTDIDPVQDKVQDASTNRLDVTSDNS